MKIYSILVMVAALACAGMFGCEPTHEIVGLWEFDQAATDQESPTETKQYRHRFLLEKDGTAKFDYSDGVFTIGRWWIETTPENIEIRNLHPFLQQVNEGGSRIFQIGGFVVYEGSRYAGFNHDLRSVPVYAYFKGDDQLVTFHPYFKTAKVYNRIE